MPQIAVPISTVCGGLVQACQPRTWWCVFGYATILICGLLLLLLLPRDEDAWSEKVPCGQ